MINSNLITKEWRDQGVEVKEPNDHILELHVDGQCIAVFTQTGVQIENTLKEIEVGKYGTN